MTAGLPVNGDHPPTTATWELTLHDRPAVPTVRAGIRARLIDSMRRGELEDALLVMTELVTNAYLHTACPRTLRLIQGEGTLRIEVRDGDPASPTVRSPNPTQTAGRGMLLVDCLAREWGTDVTATGKTVWAVLPAPPLP